MPGRIDNDIKNRFNASLRKYKTFDEYLESIDKKRAKHQKKMYWRQQQHYELRSANNSKKPSISKEGTQEFKDHLVFQKERQSRDDLERSSYDKVASEKKMDEIDGKKVPRTRLRDEKCLRKQEEKIKRRRSSIRKYANADDEKTEEKDQTSSSESEDKEMSNMINMGLNEETENLRKLTKEFSQSENQIMEESDHESQNLSASKANMKNEGIK
jgi:hypothetical protein